MLKIPSSLVTENVDFEIGSNEPWPDNVKLFQPLERDQILLPDNANCLAVRAFLEMCNLKYEVIYRENTEDMSPSGRVPFIKCGAFLIAELEPLINFVKNKNISLTEDLDPVQKSDIRAYMSLINTVLLNAELYITWCDPETYNEVTKPRYSSVYPFPLDIIKTWLKRQKVMKKLKALGWLNKTLEEVHSEVDTCCSALSNYLEDKKYYFGDKPTELDAMVFAHVFTALATPLPSNQFAATIRSYPNLVEHCQRIEKAYFNNQNN
uniref:GST C-terminal domain-containing protein n=1 Tax=Clastoptera arizonana TaxID=38151 RepID=A0A1B6EAB1_9HEMI